MVQTLREKLSNRGPHGCRSLHKDEICDLLLTAGPLELAGYRRFSEREYGRNRVHLCEDFELAVICWKHGQKSDIHDHGHSLCAYLVVEGQMTEDLFEAADGDRAEKVGERRFGVGEVTVAEGHHIHRIRNGAEAELVTVHLYTPPMENTSRVYCES